MDIQRFERNGRDELHCSRRGFLGGALAAAASGAFLGGASSLAAEKGADPGSKVQRKIKMGLVGCGGRGSWIAGHFQGHGGYEIVAVADYDQGRADQCGDKLGVAKGRRFSGLSGYQKVIESGIEAIVLQTPPCFFQHHAAAAVDAGLHVYMAKPVAVDVPGCLRVGSLGKAASAKQRVFLVDYQMPTDPVNLQVAERIWKGEMGPLAKLATVGVCGGHDDPPKTATIESRLHSNVWDNDVAIGGGYINVFDIHAIDAAIWVARQRPVAAMGASRICRANPHGDSHDVCSVVYEYADGLIHEHSGVALPNGFHGELSCTIFAPTVYAVVNYWDKARFQPRGKEPFAAQVENLYEAGAKRNVATFYEDVTKGRFENSTVPRAVDGALTCILGREAGLRRGRLTMESLIGENKAIELDLSGLKT